MDIDKDIHIDIDIDIYMAIDMDIHIDIDIEVIFIARVLDCYPMDRQRMKLEMYFQGQRFVPNYRNMRLLYAIEFLYAVTTNIK